jgi:hypothetical protein
MNQEERDWLEWLKRAQDGVVTQRQAAEKMGDRWVRKLLGRMKIDGDGVVIHGLRGRVSNRQIDPQTQARAIELLRQAEWHDFGPTFASEQLSKRHSIEVSKETVRSWMVSAGLWKARPRKGVVDLHRALTPQIDLASALSHVEQRVVSNDYTFSFAGRRYQIARSEVKAGMRGKSLRVELQLTGVLRARFEGRHVEVSECGAKAPSAAKPAGKPVRKDHNRGGKSDWMDGFFERPGPELWQAVRTAIERN